MKLENKELLSNYVKLVEDSLYKYNVVTEDTQLHRSVIDAMNYSLSAGGKRLRPVLAMEFCKVCGGSIQDALDVACCIEMIHTSSLIHDDLPCMDNDDFRRGKPSCHKQFEESIALLAGDNLLIKPFEVVAKNTNLNDTTKVKIMETLSMGVSSIIGGQVLDLENEHRKDVTEEILLKTYTKKTSDLIKTACVCGCLCANKHQDYIPLACEYAENLGIAFQIIDDILDVTSTQEVLGKPIGSDQEQNKTTFITLFGLQTAQKKAKVYTGKALKVLTQMDNSDFLIDLTNNLLNREY